MAPPLKRTVIRISHLLTSSEHSSKVHENPSNIPATVAKAPLRDHHHCHECRRLHTNLRIREQELQHATEEIDHLRGQVQQLLKDVSDREKDLHNAKSEFSTQIAAEKEQNGHLKQEINHLRSQIASIK